MSKVLSKKFKLSILIILVLLVSTGCMPGDGSYNSQNLLISYQVYGMDG